MSSSKETAIPKRQVPGALASAWECSRPKNLGPSDLDDQPGIEVAVLPATITTRVSDITSSRIKRSCSADGRAHSVTFRRGGALSGRCGPNLLWLLL